jgi:transcriptional regulator with XRE-family HTH domain
MSNLCERLLEERKRLGFTQTDFGALGGVSKWTQLNYETGTNNPDLDYLVKIGTVGADILYILTGNHGATSLSSEEESVLVSYRAIASAEQKAALVALMITMKASEHG